MELAFMI